ncbi:putative nwd2 protein [Mycena sanguinolenta]|uniref:Putative nwd2 protein n=1 Tax=Mycena sanguinolenta TaxID=230812 RepID=A0A8H7CF24_9AGAR|nr:putative nwd2 protein [Mycena sanguinolenta]
MSIRPDVPRPTRQFGGTGGRGGSGYGNGVGGTGGDGEGARLYCDIYGNVNINNAHPHRDRGVDILHHAATLAAMHDSVESFPQPKCHPETRAKMLEDLRQWAVDSHTKPSITWVYGPAGAGKSALMQTLARQLQDAGRLGGCFFFKRADATRGNGKTLFSTVAYQLALSTPWLRATISQVVENNPSLVARSIDTQMERLISEPCSPHANRDFLAIIIDGLDECEGHGVQEEILRAVRNSCDYIIPFNFFVASRPEPHIREVFDSSSYSRDFRPFNVEQSFDDVRKYLRDEFLRIHREHRTMAKIPLPWPSWDVLEQLVNNSCGHFIYAATIIKFIDDKNYRPTERLEVVQNPNSSGPESAFDTLDQLYMTILHSAQRQSELIPILCAISYFQLVASDIDQLFGLAEGETRLLLRGLHSLLDVPSESEDNSDDGYDKHSISLHHASFGDFLRNPDRSGNFCVGPFQRRRTWLLSRLIHFIVSLPPSDAVAELFPLIGSINPDYIFDQGEILSSYNDELASWLKNMRSPPTDVIELWEDYAFMVSIDNMP